MTFPLQPVFFLILNVYISVICIYGFINPEFPHCKCTAKSPIYTELLPLLILNQGRIRAPPGGFDLFIHLIIFTNTVQRNQIYSRWALSFGPRPPGFRAFSRITYILISVKIWMRMRRLCSVGAGASGGLRSRPQTERVPRETSPDPSSASLFSVKTMMLMNLYHGWFGLVCTVWYSLYGTGVVLHGFAVPAPPLESYR